MVSSDQGPAHCLTPELPGLPPFPCQGRGLSLELAKSTSPHIPGPECPGSEPGTARQGLAQGGVDATWKQGAAVETMRVWHTPASHSQAGDGLGHHWGSRSLGTGSCCKGLTQPRTPSSRRPCHTGHPNLAAAAGPRSIPLCYLICFSMVFGMCFSSIFSNVSLSKASPFSPCPFLHGTSAPVSNPRPPPGDGLHLLVQSFPEESPP